MFSTSLPTTSKDLQSQEISMGTGSPKLTSASNLKIVSPLLSTRPTVMSIDDLLPKEINQKTPEIEGLFAISDYQKISQQTSKPKSCVVKISPYFSANSLRTPYRLSGLRRSSIPKIL